MGPHETASLWPARPNPIVPLLPLLLVLGRVCTFNKLVNIVRSVVFSERECTHIHTLYYLALKKVLIDILRLLYGAPNV